MEMTLFQRHDSSVQLENCRDSGERKSFEKDCEKSISTDHAGVMNKDLIFESSYAENNHYQKA